MGFAVAFGSGFFFLFLRAGWYCFFWVRGGYKRFGVLGSIVEEGYGRC